MTYLRPRDDFESLPLELLENTHLGAFSRIVNKFPDNIAITSNGRQITYQGLNKLSNAVAHYIVSVLGDGKSPVALLLRHDIEAVVALLGVLKSGRPYVAMDTSFPVERMKLVMADSQAGMILTDDKYQIIAKEILIGQPQTALLNIDELDLAISDKPREAVISPRDPGIIFYTSGSTGKPKGVVWSHQQIISNTVFYVNEIRMAPSDRCTLLSSIAFAASRTPLFDTLACGARICMFDLKSSGVNGLMDWLVAEQATLFRGAAQIFRAVFSGAPKGFIFPSLRMVSIGGQPATAHDIELCREHTRLDCSFHHMLANTETGVLASYSISRETILKGELIPVGDPLGDKDIHIVDDNGQIVGDGQEGEIVVRSKFLSLGYLNDPELNAQKFKIHPDGSTTFFTGDLGRWNEDGLLEHLGRRDESVKIRGYTVNLSEIEIGIRKYLSVDDVAVTAIDTGQMGGSKQIVAYIVPVSNTAISVNDVRTILMRQLPGYMVPAFVEFLDTLPKTPTGKVDKRALPPIKSRQELDVDDLPGDVTEAKLLKIWEQILGVKTIGVQDRFFDIGGDSLMAMSLLLSIERSFSRRMPLAIISQASTIKQQAQILRDVDSFDITPVLIPIHTQGNKKPIYCIGGKGGNPIRFHHLLRYLDADQPVYFLRNRGFETGERIVTTVEAMASDYLIEIKRIQQSGPYCFLGESGGGLVAYEMAQQLRRQSQQTALVGLLDTYLFDMRSKKDPLSVNPIALLQKHAQTLMGGGANGLLTYLKYYVELWRYKAEELEYQRRKKKVLSGSEEILRIYEKVEEANIKASQAYVPKPYPGRVVLFSAERQIRLENTRPDHGWKDVGIGELIIHPLDCYHGNILFEPFVRQVAEKVNQYLDPSSGVTAEA